MAFTARIDNKKGRPPKLVIEIDLEDAPRPSKSGRNLVIATSHGNQPTAVMHAGKPLIIGFNVYYRADKVQEIDY